MDIVNILQWWGDNSVLIMDTNIDNLYFTQCDTVFITLGVSRNNRSHFLLPHSLLFV